MKKPRETQEVSRKDEDHLHFLNSQTTKEKGKEKGDPLN